MASGAGKQVNFKLHAEVRAMRDRTGATFTRIVHAALLYAIHNDYEPWMTLASRLDRREIKLADVPALIEQYERDRRGG